MFGLGLLLTSVLTLFTALAAEAGPPVLMGLRFVEGVGEVSLLNMCLSRNNGNFLTKGVLFPSMHSILGSWIPPLERSKLPAFAFAGIEQCAHYATFSM